VGLASELFFVQTPSLGARFFQPRAYSAASSNPKPTILEKFKSVRVNAVDHFKMTVSEILHIGMRGR